MHHDHEDRAEERSGNVPNQDSVRKDVPLLNCGSTKGGWSAGGGVRNTLGHDTTFDITVFFTLTEVMDLASAATSVPLNAHQSKLWSVKGNYAAPAQALCVLRGIATHLRLRRPETGLPPGCDADLISRRTDRRVAPA